MENKNQQFNNALFFAPMVLLMFFGFAVCLMMAWPADVQAADPNKTISIDFDSEEDYVESDGVKGKFSKSTLTDAQKDAVIAEVQKEYDDAVGPGKIKVKKGKDGDVKLTVNGGYAPGVNKGKELGDAGQAGQSGIAHESEFKDHGVTGDDLVKALGTALGHEAGHKLGKSHNDGNPNNKMTKGKSEPTGKGLTLDDLKAGNLMFSDTDKAQLLKNLGLTNAEHKMTILPTDLGVIVGKRIKSEEYCPIIDDYLDSYAVLTGPTGIEFGYMSFTNEFVYEGGDMLTFIYSAGEDIAVRLGEDVYSLSNGAGTYTLSNPNPDNLSVFQTADFYFDTSGGIAHLTLNAAVDPTTGGFYVVPEPASALLIGAGLLFARLRRKLS